MSGKKCKSLRAQSSGKNSYKHLKKVCSAQARTDASQCPKATKLRAHKRKKATNATWPASIDQVRQSRPLIVLRPVRALARAMLASNPTDERGTRYLSQTQFEALARVLNAPKHQIDRLALSY